MHATEARGPRRIGVVGLGAGNLAAYGRAGDRMRIYEINDQVLELARTEFTFLADTRAKVETVLGDRRLMLSQDPPQDFDVLVMDAFSGDSIPVHLLTEEAIAEYVRHLDRDGILALHITNSHLDLKPVVAAEAARVGRVAFFYDDSPRDEDPICLHSD
jgi:spermidine synthase